MARFAKHIKVNLPLITGFNNRNFIYCSPVTERCQKHFYYDKRIKDIIEKWAEFSGITKGGVIESCKWNLHFLFQPKIISLIAGSLSLMQ